MPSKSRSSPKKLRSKEASKKKKEFTLSELIESADQAATDNPSQALTLYTAALHKSKGLESTEGQIVPIKVDLLEKRGEVKVSLGDQEGALSDFLAAISSFDDVELNAVQSDRKAGLLLSAGQLQGGSEALESYRTGINELYKALRLWEQELLEIEKEGRAETVDSAMADKMDSDGDGTDSNDTDPASGLKETQIKIAKACCTVAELFLTDLCYEENAEQECESFLNQSLQFMDKDGTPIIDSLQVTASLRLSQSRGLEAAEPMMKAFAKMEKGCRALAALVGLRDPDAAGVSDGEAMELLELDSVQALPGFEFRCQTAKLLLECATVVKENEASPSGDADASNSKVNQYVQAAIDVLGSLLAENDEVIEIWLLSGDAFSVLEPANMGVAAHYWERALEMLNDVKRSIIEDLDEVEDDEGEEELQRQLEDIDCQIEELKTKIEHDAPDQTAAMEE